MKKAKFNLLKFICIFFLILIISSYINIIYSSDKDKLKITSNAAILIEPESGRVLYSKNERERVKIASVTKLMTGILTVENSNMNDLVLISKNSAYIGGSTVGLKKDTKVSIKSLIYGMFLESGNDCAIAAAEHVRRNSRKLYNYDE